MKYEGEVRELELIPALVELGSEGFTGALRFENDSIIKIVYFKEGSVLSASTNDRSDSIDEILLKSGKVSRDHVKQALTKRKDDETLGDALLGLGFITRKELSWARRVQLIGILRSITTWSSGSYTLVADYLPKREDGPAFQLEQIVLELVLTDGDRPKFDALLESGAVVFRPSDSFDERFPRLGLNQEAAAVVRLINGSRTASDVIAESTSDAFNVYKLMHALHILGLLEKSSVAFDFGASGAPAAGVSPTVEMPMDFGSMNIGEPAAEPPSDLSFEMPSTDQPGVDLSWQEPAEPEYTPAKPPSAGSDLLPSIDESLVTESSGYDYEPSVPEGKVPPVLLTEDLPAEMPGADHEPIPAYVPPGKKPAPPLRQAKSGGSSAGRNIAFAVVGLVILAAVGYAGWFMFMKPGEEPVPSAVVSAPEPAPAADTVAAETAAEPAPPVAETVAETKVPSPEATKPPAETRATPAKPAPPPAPKPVPTTAPSSGRVAERARANVADARGVPYAVQFAILCQESSVENSMKVGGSDFWFVPIEYQGRSCYRALWGRYASRADAERGATSIPASLRGGKPVVVEPAKFGN